MRNGPNTAPLLELPIQSDVRVWRESEGWKGPFKLLATEGETCLINMPYGPTRFRSTVIKPYYTAQRQDENQEVSPEVVEEREPESIDEDIIRVEVPNNFNHRQQHIHFTERNTQDNHFDIAFQQGTGFSMTFLTRKEESDLELSLKLRKQGLITTPGQPFEASQKTGNRWFNC